MNFRNLFSKNKGEKEPINNENETFSEDIVEEVEDNEEKIEVSCKIEPRDFFWKNDGSDPKFVDKLIKIWYSVMCFFWFIVGTITYAPILFISKKIDSVFKDKKKSLIIASAIYGIIIFTILFLFCFNRGEANVQND